MIFTQLIISLFVLFALSRVLLRFREGKLSYQSLVAWCILWTFVFAVVLKPQITTHIAQIVGIGRGADLIIYSSIAVLFYLIFRIYIKLEENERNVSTLIRIIALSRVKKPKNKSKK